MPGTYIVGNRGAQTGRAGLALPLPPTQGPLILERGTASLDYKFMGALVSGDPNAYPYEGIWTDGISDCVVLMAMEWDFANWRWSHFCYQHLRGGWYNDWKRELYGEMDQEANCFAVIAARDWTGTGVLRDEMVDWGIPNHRITVYVSGVDFRFGFRFFGGYFGEV